MELKWKKISEHPIPDVAHVLGTALGLRLKTLSIYPLKRSNADSMRYLCVSLSKTRDSLSAEDLDKRYMQAVYGDQSSMPAVFRDDLPPY